MGTRVTQVTSEGLDWMAEEENSRKIKMGIVFKAILSEVIALVFSQNER